MGSQTDPLGLVQTPKQKVWKTGTSAENTRVATSGSNRGASQPATGTSPTGRGGGPWKSAWSDEHRRQYYYNEDTREAVWELPTGSRPSAPPPAVHDPDTLIAYESIRRHLGGYGGGGAGHYFSLFGETRLGTAPFGSRVWNGIKVLAASDAKLRQYPLEDIRMGWFHAPQPFSYDNAKLPIEQDQWWQMPYPAVFVKSGDGELWIVRCLAILLNNGKNWYTHWFRVTLLTTEDDVIPPPFRPPFAGWPAYAGWLFSNRGGACQPAAKSTSTSTASGTSTPRSLPAETSSPGDGTDFTIIDETDGACSEQWVLED